ncbi:MAG TPA: alcohol dehydrogenase catalytic domain-containing protein, partial [Chryseosolibacter sp.]|nr:alcohol dehydrogenase catalytic domain-containing protein [Chryseosolibacter sp.]
MREYYEVPRTGSLSNLIHKRSPIPALEREKVLVGVRAVGLNYADVFAVMGLYSATPRGTFTPGLEFAGEVLETASPLFRRGDRVMGVTRFGGYTSHIVADPDYLMPLPAGWTFQEGAAFPVQTLTAYYAMKTLGDIRPGQTVLIHSAAGGVGLQANRIAKKFSAYTIGVVGNPQKLPVLTTEEYDAGIVRDKHFEHKLKIA